MVVAALGRRQHGVVARRQLLAQGVSSSAISRMVSSGWLVAVHRGIYRVAGHPVGPHGQWMAAVLAGGAEAFLSHRSAAELWKLLEPIEGPVHITAEHGRRQLGGIRFHWSRHLGRPATVHGIPVATIPQTLLDLAEVVSPTQLRHAFDEADRRDQLRRRELTVLCERTRGRRGLGALRALLHEPPIPLADARSNLEEQFLRYCRDRGLPIPAMNVPVAGYEVDCVWPDHLVVLELDSWTHHADREAFETDRKRDAAIQVAGYRILRVTHRRMHREGDQLEAEIRRLVTPRAG